MRSMVALLTGLGSGYLNGQERAEQRLDAERRRKREDDNAAYLAEQRDRQRTEWREEDALKTQMREAAAPVSTEVYQPANDDDGNPMPANPTEGRTAPRPMSDVLRRQSDVQQRAGRAEMAMKVQQTAQALEKEGHVRFVVENLAKLPAAEQLKQAGGAVDFDLQGLDAFNGTGATKIPPGSRGRAKVVKLPNGQEVTDFNIVGPDGQEVPGSGRQVAELYMLGVAGQQKANADMAKDATEATYKDRMGRAALGRVENTADANSIKEHVAIHGKPGAGGGGGIGSRRGDQFDEKQWSAAHKVETSFVSIDDEASGKAKELPELRQVYRSAVNRLRERGDVGPDEAAEQARTTVLQLREQAEADVAAARAADKKSTLTVQQAIKNIVKEFEASKTPKPAPPAPPKSAAGKAMAEAPPGGVVLDKASGKYVSAGGMAAAAAAAPASDGTDPAMEARLQQETREMNAIDGKRLAYSNEVTAYLKKKREAKDAAAAAAGEAFRAAEVTRALQKQKQWGY